jgi:hypothetical protein
MLRRYSAALRLASPSICFTRWSANARRLPTIVFASPRIRRASALPAVRSVSASFCRVACMRLSTALVILVGSCTWLMPTVTGVMPCAETTDSSWRRMSCSASASLLSGPMRSSNEYRPSEALAAVMRWFLRASSASRSDS